MRSRFRRREGLVPELDPRGVQYLSWYTWEVHFQPGEIRRIRTTYWVKNLSWSNGEVMSGYIITTGSTWSGSIGHARITLEMQDVLPYEIRGVKPGATALKATTLCGNGRTLTPGRTLRWYSTAGA